MPERSVIVDSGPLVAMLTHSDQHHAWAVEQIRSLRAPLLTCEAVLTEAFHLLSRCGLAKEFIAFIRRGSIAVPFAILPRVDTLATLIHQYRRLPMSLADACLVRMSEQIQDSLILTTDSDFLIYRKHRRQMIPLIFPEA